ncbi:MAG: cytochrome c biogenesis heme-transporting ATPase CcmA [bacterium]
MTTAHKLEVENLACRRGDRLLFKKQSFELSNGQLLLVEGRNGSGKTTLLKTLVTLRLQDRGTILWNGSPIEKQGSEYLKHVAWLGHHNGIKNDLTAAENLRITRSLMVPNSRKISDVLEVIGLKGYRHTAARNFSAGMRRRLGIARLLLSEAKLWILDEPQSALDKKGIELFESLATEHMNQGGMVVMTSHHDVGFHAKYIKTLRLS